MRQPEGGKCSSKPFHVEHRLQSSDSRQPDQTPLPRQTFHVEHGAPPPPSAQSRRPVWSAEQELGERIGRIPGFPVRENVWIGTGDIPGAQGVFVKTPARGTAVNDIHLKFGLRRKDLPRDRHLDTPGSGAPGGDRFPGRVGVTVGLAATSVAELLWRQGICPGLLAV